MRRQAVRVVRLSVGSVLLVVGVIGAFVPILQGWIFVLAGLSVMAPESPRARRALDWAKQRLRRATHSSGEESEGRPVGAAEPRAWERSQPKKK